MNREGVRVTTNLPSKFLDRFIDLNVKQKQGLDLDLAIVVITDLSKTYTKVSNVPMEAATTSPAPFRGKSAKECFELLQAFVKDTGNDINVDFFAAVDERSREDDTVLIVQASKDTGRIKTARGALRETDMLLVNL